MLAIGPALTVMAAPALPEGRLLAPQKKAHYSCFRHYQGGYMGLL
jgi:hypothetical protein